MARIEKLRDRLRSCPSDPTWDELTRVLAALGYVEKSGSGSRRKFCGEGLPSISLHAPHPGSIVKLYAVRQVVELLVEEGLL